MLESLLKKIGLTDKEAKVYLATLELGEDSVQNIAKKAQVNRPNTYVILDKLIKMGLASTVERAKKTIFIAENPKELTNILEKEKREIEFKERELTESMSQFDALFNLNKSKPAVRFYEGFDGLESMDRYGRNQLKKGDESMSIIPIDLVEKLFPQRRKEAIGERVDLGIRTRTIYTHKDGEISGLINKKELRDAVFISRDKFPINATLSVYPQIIKIFYFDPIKPYGVIIESKEIVNNFKLFFDLAWLGATQLKSNNK